MYIVAHQFLYDPQYVILSSLDVMLVSHDGDLIRLGAVFVGQLNADPVVVPYLVDGGSLAADDVRVVLWVD